MLISWISLTSLNSSSLNVRSSQCSGKSLTESSWSCSPVHVFFFFWGLPWLCEWAWLWEWPWLCPCDFLPLPCLLRSRIICNLIYVYWKVNNATEQPNPHCVMVLKLIFRAWWWCLEMCWNLKPPPLHFKLRVTQSFVSVFEINSRYFSKTNIFLLLLNQNQHFCRPMQKSTWEMGKSRISSSLDIKTQKRFHEHSSDSHW